MYLFQFTFIVSGDSLDRLASCSLFHALHHVHERGSVIGLLVKSLVREVRVLHAAHLEVNLRQTKLAAGLPLPARLRVRVEQEGDRPPIGTWTKKFLFLIWN